MRVMTSAMACSILTLTAYGQTGKPASRPATQPASRPATTQPATVNKYYNLMRIEFMHREDGSITLTTPEVQAQIAGMRAAAAREKADVDADIAGLTRQVGARESGRRSAKDTERNERSEQAEHRGKAYRTGVRSGRVVRGHSQREEDISEAARRRAEEAREQARGVQGAVRAGHADLLALKRRSAALAAITAPNSRIMPPEEFWPKAGSPERADVARVGISLKEFEAMAAKLAGGDTQFLAGAARLEQGTTTQEAVERLRAWFARTAN
jgi:hypothetical protein